MPKPNSHKRRHRNLVVSFDEDSRRDFLTGFRKRKLERREVAKQQQKDIAKKARKRVDSDKRTKRNELLAQIADENPTVKALLDHAEADSDDDILGGDMPVVEVDADDFEAAARLPEPAKAPEAAASASDDASSDHEEASSGSDDDEAVSDASSSSSSSSSSGGRPAVKSSSARVAASPAARVSGQKRSRAASGNQAAEPGPEFTKRAKKNKNKMTNAQRARPKELSSKAPVSRFRLAVPAPAGMSAAIKRRNDPRFDKRCGDLDLVRHDHHYEFLDDIRNQEIDQIQRTLGKEKGLDEDDRDALVKEKQRRESMIHASSRRRRMATVKQKHYAEENAKAKEFGKEQFHLSKKKLKELELVERYKEMKAKGTTDAQVDRYLEKQRKRRAAKDRKKLPERPQGRGGPSGGFGGGRHAY